MAAPNPATKAAYGSASEGLAPLIGKSYHVNIDGHIFKIPAHPISSLCYMRSETISAYRAVLSGKYTARQESFLFGVEGSVASSLIDKPISPPPTSAPIIPPPANLRNTPPARNPQTTQPARNPRADQFPWHPPAEALRRAARIPTLEPSVKPSVGSSVAETRGERRLSEGCGATAVGIERERGTRVSAGSSSSAKASATTSRQATKSDLVRIAKSTNTPAARPSLATSVMKDVGTKRKRQTDPSPSVSKATTKKRVRFEEDSLNTDDPLWENRWSSPSQFKGEVLHNYWRGGRSAKRIGFYIQDEGLNIRYPNTLSPIRTKVLTQRCQLCVRRGEVCKILVDGIGIGVKTKQCGFCISNNQDCSLSYSGEFGG